MLFRIILIVLVFIVHIVISNIIHTTSKQLIPRDTLQPQSASNEVSGNSKFDQTKEKVCTDIDIRNYVSSFDVLKDCTVVEGFVQINLIDNSTAQDFENITFPKLREITEYLSFYHVSGLKSIGKLFPNLAIIRGNTLIWDYTFSVFSMFNLQEIGLHRLTHIMKGTVVILRNPGLCFVHTIDWKRITKKGSVVINDIKSKEACLQEGEPGARSGPEKCEFYWSNNDCQLIKEIEECHPLCAGGCTGKRAEDCFVCIGFIHDGHCLDQCPPNLYSYMNRRCLTREECLNNKRVTTKNFPQNMRMSYSDKAKWRPFNGSCMEECPPGYNTTADETSCVPCPDCPKVCKGVHVKSIEVARSTKGCTVINGSLGIQIQTGDSEVVHQELEKGLGMITNITGHLKISHSLPIQSLSFLKSLQSIHGEREIIRGDTSESSVYSNYSLIVWDNPNLQELWGWSNLPDGQRPKFEIKKGKILFHDNPKLCLDKIYELINVTNITYDSDFDVLKESNGDEFICGFSNLALVVLNKTDVSIRFQLNENEKVPDNQRYVLFYMKADNGMYTDFDTVGSCSASGWKFKDINSKNKTVEVMNLEPATEYAFFVKIYNSQRIVRSNISLQTTLPTKPSIPYQFEVVRVNSSSVTLRWGEPKHPHGILEKYVIKAYYQDYDKDYLDTRNYCVDKLRDLSDSTYAASHLMRFAKTTRKPLKECCGKFPCDFDHESFQYMTSQMQLIQQCDNYIFKYLQYNDLHKAYGGDLPSLGNISSRLPDREENDVLYPETSYTMVGLGHFRSIVFTISACRKEQKDKFLPYDPEEGRCSEETLVMSRTEVDHLADTIPADSLNFEMINASALRIRWHPPSRPNGIIVAYNIEYKRESGGNSENMCRTRKDIDRDSGLYLYDYPAGSYLFRLRVVSLGGEGPWTSWKPCVIESAETPMSVYVIVVVTGLVILFCMLAVILFLMYLQKKNLEKRKKDQRKLIASVNPEYVKVPYVADEWEVERDDVELRQVLGKGTFGVVHEGFIKSRNLKCAVKTIMDTANDRDRMEFLNEASTMKTFSTAHNIVKLLGVVSKGHPPYILLEYMECHDLKTFLRNTRESDKTPPPPSVILIKMAAQIADGMEYMEARKFVHRDLAARNCMVASDLSVKIGDLGMSRDVYHHDYYRKGGKGLMPVRWMAPESLNDGVFTSYSDVWSYGIVLWEMAMLAEQPYQGFSNEEVFKYVVGGGTLTSLCMPPKCPEVMRNIMIQAWAWRPSSRPTFHQIVSMCEKDVDDKFRSTSFHHSQECKDLRESRAASSSSRRLLNTSEETVETRSPIEQVVSYHKSNNSSSSNSASGNVEILKES
ncbi:insulin-like peptide receptor [Diaphorina citri]|uniref:Tyrosine-protein kinase receptor n=1 Tax=Diaphorina citri TaxID=121845 RepID=A0A1S3DD17_DIACI|nr:insulin-like peptide receptor [Diaphorina citri]